MSEESCCAGFVRDTLATCRLPATAVALGRAGGSLEKGWADKARQSRRGDESSSNTAC